MDKISSSVKSILLCLSGKHGVASEECLDLVQYVKEECDHLSFGGLMTIGRMNHQPDVNGPNPDFMVK